MHTQSHNVDAVSHAAMFRQSGKTVRQVSKVTRRCAPYHRLPTELHVTLRVPRIQV